MSYSTDDIAVRVADLCKTFRVYPNSLHRLANVLTGGRRGRCHRVTALAGVSFDAPRGQALGIVGANGAGKSTLLKIIAGTLHPTTGRLQVQGRVAAMLELGMGFNGQLTGRQNIRLSGLLMGLTAQQIEQSGDRIVAFSELGDFIDQPLRTYSTGMAMRLAYSVAAASRPDVLIIDEALSVGDAYFQQKCYAHLESFLSDGGTVLFVSHDAGAVTRLCSHALLLDHGRVITAGRPLEVLEVYNARLARLGSQQSGDIQTQHGGAFEYRGATRSGQFRAVILDAALLDEHGQPARTFMSGRPATLRIHGAVIYPVGDLTVGMQIRDRFGTPVFGQNTYQLRRSVRGDRPGGFQTEFRLTLDLGPGDYTISAALHSAEQHLAGSFDWADRLVSFVIAEDPARRFTGLVRLPVELRVNQQDEVDRAALQALLDELFAAAPSRPNVADRSSPCFLAGLYPPEEAPFGVFRWCGPEAVIAVRPAGATLCVDVLHDRLDAKDRDLVIRADAAGLDLGTRSISYGPARQLKWALPADLTGHVTLIRLRCEPTFQPAIVEKSVDGRELGMKLLGISAG